VIAGTAAGTGSRERSAQRTMRETSPSSCLGSAWPNGWELVVTPHSGMVGSPSTCLCSPSASASSQLCTLCVEVQLRIG